MLKKVTRENGGSRLRIDFFGIEEEFIAPLVSRTHVENLFAAILVAQRLGMKNFEIQEAVSRLQPPGRPRPDPPPGQDHHHR